MRFILAAILAATASQSCASAPPDASIAGDYLSGRLAARFNAVEDAARIYSQAHSAAPGEIQLLRDAFFYRLAAGDIDSAALFGRAIIAAKPGEEDGLARLAVAAADLKLGKLDAARAMLAGEMSADYFKAVAFVIDAWIENELNGPEAALKRLELPTVPLAAAFTPLHRALLSETAGRADDARAAFQVAVLGGGGAIGVRSYGAFLERSGDLDAARDFYAQLVPQEGPARRVAKSAAKRLALGERSTEFYRISSAEGAAIAFYSLSQAMMEQATEQRERAELAGFQVGDPRFNMPLAVTRLALHLDPDLDEARRLTALILNVYGDYGGASQILARIPEASPHYEQARLEMAAGLLAGKDEKGAERLLRVAIRSDPESDALKTQLASLYAAKGDFGRAVKIFDGLIAKTAEPAEEAAWRLYVARGAALIELDRWAAAESDLKKAVAAAPDEPEALNYLGYSWAERGTNLEEAFKLIEKAVELRPESGAIVDSLGWAHYQLGRYAEAVGHLEKAASLEPADPTITDHLGDVYWRLGRRIEARYEWKRGLDLDPSDKLRASLEKKIVDGLEPAEADGGA